MNKVNDFQINQYVSNSTYEFENITKGNNLRAKVSLTKIAATALLTLTTVSQAQANTFDFNLSDDFKIHSLENTVSLTNEINIYSKALKNNKSSLLVDKYKIIEDVISFKSLENSWDGYDAKPLGVKCATNAIKLIELLDNNSLNKISDYFPNPHGTISFEWENGFDEIVSVEIGKDTFSYYVSMNNVDTKYYNKQNFEREDIEILKKFISAI